MGGGGGQGVRTPPPPPLLFDQTFLYNFLVLHACTLIEWIPFILQNVDSGPPLKKFSGSAPGSQLLVMYVNSIIIANTIQGYRQQMLPLLEDEGLTRKSAQLKHWKVSPRHQ